METAQQTQQSTIPRTDHDFCRICGDARPAAALLLYGSGCGAVEDPPDGGEDAHPPMVDTRTPDTSPAKLDTRTPDTSPAKLDTRAPDTSPAKLDTSPPKLDTRSSDTWMLPAGCLVCAGNGLAYPSTDPYSDGLPCASKAINYQCEDCPNGTTSRRECCTVADCAKYVTNH